jgi:hypothetical protein
MAAGSPGVRVCPSTINAFHEHDRRHNLMAEKA